MISRRLPRATRLCVLRHTAAHTSAAVPALAITPRRPARPLHTSAKTLLAAPTQQQAHTINAPFASIASSVARILPESIPQAQLPFDRDLAESVVGRTLDLARNAATAKTVEDSKAQWAMLDAQIRSGESRANFHRYCRLRAHCLCWPTQSSRISNTQRQLSPP